MHVNDAKEKRRRKYLKKKSNFHDKIRQNIINHKMMED